MEGTLKPSFGIYPATQEEAKLVDDKLSESLRSQIPFIQERTISKNYVIKEEGKIIAGLNGLVFPWGIAYVDALFVEDGHRNKSLGSSLLKEFEREAKAMGVTLVELNSFDFQAKDFYLNQGYEIFGTLDAPNGHNLYFLKKHL